MTPYFSVIIPLYNKQNHILNTINCVLQQSFKNFEIIVVNDGSTDNSLELVNTIKDSRISVYSIKNQGVSHARNYGVQQIRSERIVFLDADDTWNPEHLQTLFHLYESFPDCGLYCTGYQKQYRHGIINSIYNGIPKHTDWEGIVSDYFKASSINSLAWTSAVSVPLECFNAVGGFDETITLGAGEDIDLWIKLALQFPAAFSNKITATHNLLSENRISNSNTNSRKFINLDRYEAKAQTNKSLKKYLDLNRYAIAIQYKLVNNKQRSKDYINRLDRNNLNNKQKILLRCNPFVLKTALKFKRYLQIVNINLSAFK